MAVRFDAVGDQLNRTANLPPNGSFTYMLWAVIDNELAAGTYQPYIWALDAASQQGYACGVINGIFDIECYNGGVVASSSSVGTRPAAGQAACVYVRCSGTGAGLINAGYRLAGANAFVSSGNATLGSLNVMTQLYMGGLFGVYWQDGRKWNIKAWDRALSDAEILAESYFERVLYPASLNFHLPLTGVNDTADRSGNARNPSTAGTLTTADTRVQLLRPRRRVFVPRAAGGTVYNEVLTETVAAGATQGGAAVFPATLAEAIAAGDSLSSAVIFVGAISETVSAADALASAAIFAAAYTETVTPGDSPGGAQTFVAALSASVALADQYSSSVAGGSTTYNETISESLTLADGLVASQAMASALTESTTLGDALTAAGILGASLTEQVHPGDALTPGLVMPAALAESVSPGDVLGASVVFTATLSEAIALADALGATQVMLSAVGESINLVAAFDSTVTIPGGYPDPADVRQGVSYGPTGVEYVGTFKGGKGTVWVRRR